MQTRPWLWLSFCKQFSFHNSAAKTFWDISRSPLCAPVLSPTEEYFIIKLSLLPVRASCFSVSFSPLLILTGSLSDNSDFLLPGQASCFHCMKFSQELVLLLLPTGLLLLYRGGMIHGSGKHYPFHRAKHRERLYMCMCWCIDGAKFWLSSGMNQRDTHWAVREPHRRFQTLPVQCLLKTICLFLSCCSLFLCTPFLLISPGPNTPITANPTSFRQLLISSKKITQ